MSRHSFSVIPNRIGVESSKMLILSDYTLSAALHSGQLGLYFALQTMIIL